MSGAVSPSPTMAGESGPCRNEDDRILDCCTVVGDIRPSSAGCGDLLGAVDTGAGIFFAALAVSASSSSSSDEEDEDSSSESLSSFAGLGVGFGGSSLVAAAGIVGFAAPFFAFFFFIASTWMTRKQC